MTENIPDTQTAVQLVGPDQLELNRDKEVFKPGPYQFLAKVEVVGLCFSDLKLLKQFDAHVRKSEVLKGVDLSILSEVPSYVPGEQPTVPGHEVVVRIVEKGDRVTGIEVGDRFLVQTDYRWLNTDQSASAFGYNFEGALQEYVLMDQRVITDPDGQSMLLPADEERSASSIALVEPWACVEDSYVVKERNQLHEGGTLLVAGNDLGPVAEFFASQPKPSRIFWASGQDAPKAVAVERLSGVDDIDVETLNDVLFFGNDADLLEQIFPKVAARGLVNIVQNGQSFDRPVTCPVGRLHYGCVRISGTAGSDPAEGLSTIPSTGEISEGDRIHVVGAGGPMGTMHVIRNLCQGLKEISVVGSDLSDERLTMLRQVAGGVAKKNNLELDIINPEQTKPEGPFDYTAIMVPVPALVAAAVHDAAHRGVINIFAGIPATVYHDIDLDTYIEKQLYFIGTSGSNVNDMKIVLSKIQSGQLDTNLSVAAISGLEGAVDGIRAVEGQTMPGKIIVYPSCKGLGLTPLSRLDEEIPEVGALLDHGTWTLEAERKLLEIKEEGHH